MADSLDTIQTALLDNAGFEETGSLSEAKAFITAAKRFLIIAPASSADQGSSLTMNSAQIMDLLKRAQAYVAANDTSSANPRVRFAGFSGGTRRG